LSFRTNVIGVGISAVTTGQSILLF